MNEYIINQWNSIITPQDVVYHHGDFALNTDQETTRELINRLNGKVILILGNHDRHGKQWFLDCGLIEVYSKSLVINNFILSHKPINIGQIPDGFINIHGHIHNYDKGLDKDKYINVSCEVVDYKPIWINTQI